MRSGYLHPEVKFDFVISGVVEVWILTPHGTDKKIYRELETFEIPAYTPHALHFLEDSVIVEWWNHSAEPRCWYYHPYRNIVDVQNSLVCTSTGRHSVLVPQNDFEFHSLKNDPGIGWGSLIWLTTGLAIGAAVGATLARPK